MEISQIEIFDQLHISYISYYINFRLLIIDYWFICINPLPFKVSILNFDPLEIVSRYCDRQLQVGENYS